MDKNVSIYEPWNFIRQLSYEYGPDMALDIINQGAQDQYNNSLTIEHADIIPTWVRLYAKQMFNKKASDNVLIQMLDPEDMTPIDEVSDQLNFMGYSQVSFADLRPRYYKLEEEGKVKMGENEHGLCARQIDE